MTRYAIADLHGYYNLYKEVKLRLRPDDILYVLGDCADRGPSGWKTLRAVLVDPQCILLAGNHEIMLRDTMQAWFDIVEKKTEDLEDCGLTPEEIADEDIYWTRAYELLCMNGGEFTFWDWRREKDLYYWYDRLCNLPYEIEIFDTKVPLHLTHAGYTPGHRPAEEEELIWNRKHIHDKWPSNNNSIVIHGHTPQHYLYKELIDFSNFYFGKDDFKKYNKDSFEILGYDRNEEELYKMVYCDGHKIDIDPCTVLTKRGILLNLETLEQEMIVFLDEEIRKEL